MGEKRKEKRMIQSTILKYICAGREYNKRYGKLLNNACRRERVKEKNGRGSTDQRSIFTVRTLQ
jgi:hypothetical protein